MLASKNGSFSLILWLDLLCSSLGSMIGCLLKLKERFASCNDPEKEIMLKTWRLMLIVFSSFLCAFFYGDKWRSIIPVVIQNG